MAITEAQAKTAIQDTVKWFDQVRVLGGAATTFSQGSAEVSPVVLTTQQLACVADYRYSDWADKEAAALQTARATYAGTLAAAPAVYAWLLRDYAQALGITETASATILDRLYDDYVTNGKSIESRGLTFGSSSAGGSNYGNGVVVRLNVDENGAVLENQVADAKNARCLFDANNGASKWEEVFELRGTTAAKDQLAITGSGKLANLTAVSARTSSSIVKNPSWSSTTPAGPSTALTAIANWTSSVAISTTYYDSIGSTGVNGYYRDFAGDTVPLALRLKPGGDLVLSQNLESQRSKFSDAVPYLVQIAWRRKSSATGTLTLRLGNQSASVSVATGTNDVWNVLRFTGTKCWFKNFDKAGLSISVETSSLAVSNVDVDDLIVAPMTPFDGSWYAFVGTPATGDPLQWLLKDTFSWTDTELGEGYGIIQKMLLWRGFGTYLPSIPQAPLTAATATLSGTAGSVTTGTHVVAYTYVDGNGIESGLSPNSGAVTGDGAHRVDLTGILVGPTGTASRKVYMSKAGTTTPVFLGLTIADNSTTTGNISVADASLTPQATTVVTNGITLADPT